MLQVDNEGAMNDAEERGVSEHWFYDLRHAMIWQAMLALRNAGTGVDVITTQQWLKDRNMLEQVGGLAYLAELPDVTPSVANAPHYLAILREQLLLREVIKAGTDAVSSAYSIAEGEKTDPDQLIARLENAIGKLSEQSSTVAELRIGQILMEVMPELEDYHRGHAQIKGLTTGLEYLDKLLCGLGGPNGNYIVFSGRPSTGKTSLAMQIADYAANDYVWWEPITTKREGGGPPIPVLDAEGKPKYNRKVGIPVGVFSYEMASAALVTRMLFNRAGADLQRWRTGFAETVDIENILKASLVLGNSKLYIDDKPGPVESMRARARRMWRQYGIQCFVIDYLQLMWSVTGRRLQDRVQELAEVSRQIAELAKELNVPFIVLAQMNRDYEKDTTRAPRLSDLKDCGSIEQDADVVGFLYNAKLKEKDKAQYESAMDQVFPEGDWSKRPARVNMLIAKNRYGPAGKAELLFQKSCTRFFDWIAWLKDHGQKELAEGESHRAVASGAMPSGEKATPKTQQELEEEDRDF